MNFLHWLGLFIAAGLGASFAAFRRGGIYNPTVYTPQPSPDFQELSTTPIVPQTGLKSPPTASQKVYNAAKANLGKHLTLNSSVPGEVGCAEAVSWVLLNAGYHIPQGGIQGVLALIDWMLKNGFQEVSQPSLGAVVTAHRAGNDPVAAHTGICGRFQIMSNNSPTGTFEANYTLGGWTKYFGAQGATTRYFLPC